HSAYNPVERSMASLSTKLAAIVLPINKYGTHLDSQGKVIDLELAEKNFKYAGNLLCNLWNKDKIFRKPVMTEYVNTISTPASDISWEWIEIHARICRYSLDVKKCNNIKCCFPKRCEEAGNLLASNNGFILPLVMRKDGHYINSIHLLEYFDKKKIL
ncbi:3137_t:CDS:1, partial [Scutellospora calospora]